jgi:hypothetical protein
MRTLFLLHEQRFLYFLEPSYVELYLPMVESGLLGETLVHPYQRDLRFARAQLGFNDDTAPAEQVDPLLATLLDQKISEFKPDLVVYALTWPQDCLAPAMLARLKERHGFRLATVIWDHDETNPLLQDYDRQVIALSDCTVVADSRRRAEAIRARQGAYAGFHSTGRVIFAPMVPPASLFHPRAERRHDVTISGSSEGHRVEVFERLAAAGFATHRSGGMMPGDALLPVADYAAELATSRIVVNTQTVAQRVQLKGRVAQCLASGTFLLEQDNPESRAYLDGIEVVFWRDTDELITLVRHHLDHPQEREAIARRTHEQWKARYDARRFVQSIVRTIESAGAADATAVRATAAIHPDRSEPQPMRFSIHSGNHDNSVGITDTVLFLKSALQDCGQSAVLSHEIDRGAINIVLEHFTEERHLRPLLEGHAAGARFVLVGTEPIVEGTFNGGIDGKHWHYGNRSYWQLRFESFKAAASACEAIWVLDDSMVEPYQALFPQVPVRFLPHGWVSGFATVDQSRPEGERDIDFFFSGSLTDHRRRLLAALARQYRVVHMAPATPEYLRQDYLSRTKVCLSLRLSERNSIPSVSRMHYHLHNRNFLLHERYDLPCPLDPFVLHADSGDLLHWAHAALQLPNRREIAAAALEKFKAALPMSRLLPPLLQDLSCAPEAARPALARAA